MRQPSSGMIFLTVVGVTAVSAFLALGMALLLPEMTTSQQEVFRALESTWRTGIGAIFGLLVRKHV